MSSTGDALARAKAKAAEIQARADSRKRGGSQVKDDSKAKKAKGGQTSNAVSTQATKASGSIPFSGASSAESSSNAKPAAAAAKRPPAAPTRGSKNPLPSLSRPDGGSISTQTKTSYVPGVLHSDTAFDLMISSLPGASTPTLHECAPNSSAWKHCAQLLDKQSRPRLANVREVVNPYLWRSFQATRVNLRQKNFGKDGTRWLFHGTSTYPPQRLCLGQTGFDPRVASPGFYGEGAYFAEKSEYSTE